MSNLSNETIKRLALYSGFTTKEGGDLRSYVYEFADCVEQAVLARLAGQEPVAYLRKDQLKSVKRLGRMYGEISDKPRPDLVAVYASEEKTLEQHRTEFEAWAGSKADKSRGENYYKDSDTQYDWTIWKAARGISE